MRTIVAFAALALSAGTVPSGAEPSGWASAARIHGIHVNVFRPMAEPAQRIEALVAQSAADGGAAEVSLIAGKTDVLADTSGFATPEEGACIDILLDSVIDSGCGTVTVSADGVMGSTRISGTIETSEYAYSSDPFSIDYVGPSTVTFDVTFTGQGVIQRSPHSWAAAGVCGLPPDLVQGAFVATWQELERSAPATGSIVSDAVGPLDVTLLEPLMLEAVTADAGACA